MNHEWLMLFEMNYLNIKGKKSKEKKSLKTILKKFEHSKLMEIFRQLEILTLICIKFCCLFSNTDQESIKNKN